MFKKDRLFAVSLLCLFVCLFIFLSFFFFCLLSLFCEIFYLSYLYDITFVIHFLL